MRFGDLVSIDGERYVVIYIAKRRRKSGVVRRAVAAVKLSDVEQSVQNPEVMRVQITPPEEGDTLRYIEGLKPIGRVNTSVTKLVTYSLA